MPQPTAGDVHVNVPLTNISIAFMQQAQNFVAGRVFPVVPVQHQGNRYYTYLRDSWNRDQARKRAPGTESAGSGWDVDNTNTYFCDPYAIHKDVDDQIRANADSVINLDRDATMWVTQQLLIRRDKLWASEFFTTGVWTGSTTGGDITPATLWDAAGGTPISDITAQIVSVQKKTGFKPQKLVLGMEVMDAVRNNASVLDRIKYTQRGIVTEDILAAVLGVEEVMSAASIENTAAEGATEASDFIVGAKNALLVYAAPSPSLLSPSGGYTFSWTGYLGAGPQGNRIKRFRMEHLSSDRVEGEIALDEKLIAPELGVFFSGAVS